MRSFSHSKLFIKTFSAKLVDSKLLDPFSSDGTKLPLASIIVLFFSSQIISETYSVSLQIF
jgi:hypothetical protein